MELSNSKRPFTSTVQVNGPFAGNARLAPSRARQQCQAALPPPQSIISTRVGGAGSKFKLLRAPCRRRRRLRLVLSNGSLRRRWW